MWGQVLPCLCLVSQHHRAAHSTTEQLPTCIQRGGVFPTEAESMLGISPVSLILQMGFWSVALGSGTVKTQTGSGTKLAWVTRQGSSSPECS